MFPTALNLKQFVSIPNILRFVVAILLLTWALTKLPYNYYILLRWITFIYACYSAYLTYNVQPEGWFVTYLFIALLFNPLIPPRFDRTIWDLIDVATAVYIIVSIFSTNKVQKRQKHKRIYYNRRSNPLLVSKYIHRTFKFTTHIR